MMETGAIVSISCGRSSFEVVGGHSGKIFLLLAASAKADIDTFIFIPRVSSFEICRHKNDVCCTS